MGNYNADWKRFIKYKIVMQVSHIEYPIRLVQPIYIGSQSDKNSKVLKKEYPRLETRVNIVDL